MEDSTVRLSAIPHILKSLLITGMFVALPVSAQTSIPLNTLALNGSATLESGSYIQLTSVGSEAGSAFIPTPYTLGPNTSFEVAFVYNAYDSSGYSPGDGLAFVAQNTTMGPNFLGLGGSGLGFITLTSVPAIGASFDFCYNQYTGTSEGATAVVLPTGQDLVTAYPSPAIFNVYGDAHRYVWVDYNNPQKGLFVYYSTTSTKPATPVLKTILSQDLSSEFGGQVYFGFTGGTGSYYIQQYITKMVVNVVD